jgi:tyrosine-protein kinase Etk/Wzc
MNQPIEQVKQKTEQDDTRDMAKYLAFVVDNISLIAGVALVVTLIGVAYALLAKPVYEANILVQVEDSAAASKTALGDLTSAFETKVGAASEMEILRSRLVVSRAVDNLRLYISVQPNYFPLVGAWMARRTEKLSDPGLFGYGGFVWGAERADVSVFNVPAALQGEDFVLVANGEGRYRLTHRGQAIDLDGRVGETVKVAVGLGVIEIRVDRLSAKRGAQFTLARADRLATVERMQSALKIAEKGKQSGIIGVTLEGSDPKLVSAVLNQIGREYIRQNEDRKSDEAEKSLAFLNRQLPDIKRELNEAEAKYNKLRNKRGTIDLGEEAKAELQRTVAVQTRMVELKQKREELMTRFQAEHPAVQSIDQQMGTLTRELASVEDKIRRLPAVEQDVYRLSRDVKVNTDLYTSLLTAAQQLRLIAATKVGNARLLDASEAPRKPIKPKRSMVMFISAAIGFALGVAAALARKNLYGAIDNPRELRQLLGLSVSATIPHSDRQEQLYAQMHNNTKTVSVLAHNVPSDSAVESLRGFRASLQFVMRGANNNIIAITSPTAEVGKSFVSTNLAAVLASVGKKVLLIDGDLRKGYLHRCFGVEREKGLSEAIAGEAALDRVIHKDVVENVDFIATGSLPLKPAELLAHENFGKLLQLLSARYDFVFIDTAPVLSVADALSVGPHAGALFNIVRGGVSTVSEIEEAVKRLNQAGATVTGTVFNDLRPRSSRYGYGSLYEGGRYGLAGYK